MRRSTTWSAGSALIMVAFISWAAGPLDSAGSDAEPAILREIKDFAAARNAGDLDRILAHFADDANISNFTGRKVTRAEYRAAVKKRVEDPSSTGIKLDYRAVRMDFQDASRAVVLVEQTAYIETTFAKEGGVQERQRLQWTFAKRGERWLIVEQTWLK